MHAARRGKLDAVLVWKLDRFGRSALDVLAHLRALDGVGVISSVNGRGSAWSALAPPARGSDGLPGLTDGGPRPAM